MARSPLRAAWLVPAALLLILAHTAHLGLPVAALFAPATCAFCHACPVEHEHEACDCDECQAEAAGIDKVFKDSPCGGLRGATSLENARFVVPAPILLFRYETLVAVLDAEPTSLASRAPPRPPTPPPRA